MQSVCMLVPSPFREQVLRLRSELSRDPRVGELYDPPFVHFRLQLDEEYDWQVDVKWLADDREDGCASPAGACGDFSDGCLVSSVNITTGTGRRREYTQTASGQDAP